jgi:hypothetical protein
LATSSAYSGCNCAIGIICCPISTLKYKEIDVFVLLAFISEKRSNKKEKINKKIVLQIQFQAISILFTPKKDIKTPQANFAYNQNNF